MTERRQRAVSAVELTRYKPKGWDKYFVDGGVFEVKISESSPRVNIEYEEFGSLQACPDDTLIKTVIVKDDDREITLDHCIDTEDFKPSGHRYIISVYNKLTKKKLKFEISEDTMRSV